MYRHEPAMRQVRGACAATEYDRQAFRRNFPVRHSALPQEEGPTCIATV